METKELQEKARKSIYLAIDALKEATESYAGESLKSDDLQWAQAMEDVATIVKNLNSLAWDISGLFE